MMNFNDFGQNFSFNYKIVSGTTLMVSVWQTTVACLENVSKAVATCTAVYHPYQSQKQYEILGVAEQVKCLLPLLLSLGVTFYI